MRGNREVLSDGRERGRGGEAGQRRSGSAGRASEVGYVMISGGKHMVAFNLHRISDATLHNLHRISDATLHNLHRIRYQVESIWLLSTYQWLLCCFRPISGCFAPDRCKATCIGLMLISGGKHMAGIMRASGVTQCLFVSGTIKATSRAALRV